MRVLDLVLPPACAACGRVGSVLCGRCEATFRPASNPDDRFVAADAGVVIGEALTLAVAAFAYEGAVRRALQRLKYGGARRLAQPLARAAVPALRGLLVASGPAPLVPIPIHPERRRLRGYNQAALIAAALCAEVDLPSREVLSRPRGTTRQHRLDRVARLHNLRGAISIVDGARAPPVAILVDDILTTSATMEACAAVLREAGTQRVYGLAIAREV